MSKNQYDAPAMEVVEFGRKTSFASSPVMMLSLPAESTSVAAALGNGALICRGAAIRTKYVSTLGASAQVDALFSVV